eukprot:snap_masked-scaffold_53-processed-gene-1.43-mRNA-1 protein AED:1.00 eAED:1.00 QI:0/0/0/0/1/1/2/0/80
MVRVLIFIVPKSSFNKYIDESALLINPYLLYLSIKRNIKSDFKHNIFHYLTAVYVGVSLQISSALCFPVPIVWLLVVPFV